MRALIRTATLTGYLDMAKSFGLDGARLMRDVGLDPADIVVPDRWIPAASVPRLLDASATQARQEDFVTSGCGCHRQQRVMSTSGYPASPVP